jgi:pSer/pThr/pTyr-binding forkhead associated (FHA) protein
MTMEDYLDIEIDVFEYSAQHAQVRRGITIATLIQETLKQFDDIAADAPDKYAIYVKGADRPLNSAYTLEQLDIQPHDELVFDYVRQVNRKMLDPEDYALLREETTGKVYDIQWQPAVIGRPDADLGHNIILGVNVLPLPNGMTVSRKHAQITYSEGRYYIEPLAEHNPIFLNGKEIPLNSKRELKNNDRLGIGRKKIMMVFQTQRAAESTSAEAKSQAAKGTPIPTPPTSIPIPETAGAAVDRDEIALPAGDYPPVFLVIENCSAADRIGQKLAITEYPFLLGRSLSPLSNEKEISRKHAEITYDTHEKIFYITDLNSTNGVSLNGEKIQPDQPREIKTGAKIGLGRVVVLRFGV